MKPMNIGGMISEMRGKRLSDMRSDMNSYRTSYRNTTFEFESLGPTGFFLCSCDLLSNLEVCISDITPIWTVIVVKNHSDMRSDGSSYRISYRNLAGMSVRDFL
jgi:hypothetical protein